MKIEFDDHYEPERGLAIAAYVVGMMLTAASAWVAYDAGGFGGGTMFGFIVSTMLWATSKVLRWSWVDRRDSWEERS